MNGDDGDDLEQRRELLDAWVRKRREIAQLEAEASALLAERIRLRDADSAEAPFHRDAIHRSMIAEYSAAARMSSGTVERAFADAAFLDSEYPGLRESFACGVVTAAHVHEIIAAGAVVRQAIREGRADAGTLALYETASVVVAEEETPARTRARVRQIASALAGETEVERHRRTSSERSVSVRSVGDGLALLQLIIPEHLAFAIHDRLTRLGHQIVQARGVRLPAPVPAAFDDDPDAVYPDDLDPADARLDLLVSAGPDVDDYAIFGDADTFTTDPTLDDAGGPADERTIDQVRADLATDLLLAAEPGETLGRGLDRIEARIQVTVAAGTLSGADDRPAELDGHGPLDPDIARALAGRSASWTRLFLDHTGLVVQTDSYRPTEEMRRFLRARDQHCRFPGCRMPVHRCQTDHNHDHAKGGSTALGNLSHLCVGHHALKHPDIDDRHRWTARQLPDGSMEWTSPLGRAYTDPPPRRVMFV